MELRGIPILLIDVFCVHATGIHAFGNQEIVSFDAAAHVGFVEVQLLHSAGIQIVILHRPPGILPQGFWAEVEKPPVMAEAEVVSILVLPCPILCSQFTVGLVL